MMSHCNYRADINFLTAHTIIDLDHLIIQKTRSTAHINVGYMNQLIYIDDSLTQELLIRLAILISIGYICYCLTNHLIQKLVIDRYPLIYKHNTLLISSAATTTDKIQGEEAVEEVESILKRPFGIDFVTREAFYQNLNNSSQYLRRDSFSNE